MTAKNTIKKLLTAIGLTVSTIAIIGCNGDKQAISKAQLPAEKMTGTANKQALLTSADMPHYSTRSIQDEVFYFVLPDRFYNGDESNDLGAAADDSKRALSRGGFDKTHKGKYHGGDLAGLNEKLPYLQEMGITAIWLTPVLRNQAVQADTSGYHGYWILDFSEIDPHLGSNDELKDFIAQAHSKNIKVFFDIITNHTADVIKYSECHGEDGLGWIVSGNSCPYKSLAQIARGDSYNTIIPKGYETIKFPLWLNETKYYNNQGDSTWEGESAINGDFAGLDDINTALPIVTNGMIDIYKNIIDEFKPDGFRIDTVKHVNLDFWQQFSPALLAHAKEQGIDNFFMFGEVYSADPSFLSQFTTTGKLQSVLDFGFQSAVYQTLVEQKGTIELDKLFAQDHVYQDSDSNANLLLTFTGNHDMGRLAYQLRKSEFNYSEQEQIQRNLLAHALMFFSRGVPVIYYGDEQGFVGDGGDQDTRQDMMPSLVASYNDDDLLASDRTTADDNFDRQHPFYQKFSIFADLYLKHPALRYGAHTTVSAQEAPGIYAFTRTITADNNKVLVVVNTATTAQTFNYSADMVKRIYQDDENASLQQSDAGQFEISIPALSFAIYQIQ
ncbi:alpha-amylase family glycosyl hydrolase [Colwelliaceae bacterium 6471]